MFIRKPDLLYVYVATVYSTTIDLYHDTNPMCHGYQQNIEYILTTILTETRYALCLSVIELKSSCSTSSLNRERSAGVNSTYGVINYPMIKAVVECSISEFWNLKLVYMFLYHPQEHVHTRRF